ncbi:hypothetical protein AGR7B_Lc110205 [Agrobacterium deltaense RV3]|nr:hypothetical protein AGR7B_Lc110205 [Agrobacterium deltaense RV3]
MLSRGVIPASARPRFVLSDDWNFFPCMQYSTVIMMCCFGCGATARPVPIRWPNSGTARAKAI